MSLTTHPKPLLARDWERLDNAGKIYPAVSTQKWSSLFRVAIVLKSVVDPEFLQRAADAVLPRFPHFNAQLSAGFYWYYLRLNPKRLLVEPDIAFPCAPIHWRRKDAHLLKIFYSENKIALDIFHAITDGHGAMVFLKTLVAEYLRLKGIDVPAELGVLDLHTSPSIEEVSDASARLPLPKSKGLTRPTRAYRFPLKQDKHPTKHIHTYIINVTELKNKASEYNLTINEYLTAAFLYLGVREQIKEKPRKLLPVRVSVPVNLRRFSPTNTLRNFSTFVTPELTPPFSDISFEAIAITVRDYMQKALTTDNLYSVIAPQVALERNIFSRLTPLFLKNFLLQIGYKVIASKTTTTTLTNLGVFIAPEPLLNEIVTVEVMLGPARNSGVGATILTTRNTMRIAFTSTQIHPSLAEGLEALFLEQGIKTKREIINE